ncbi:MAG: YggS family pyridoxal phosphate-dependent enzyme [Chloroflexi bacterium]|nr:YggS family pyridoxal phosphate-dependent enzyme [Chloroflexota bacterium]
MSRGLGDVYIREAYDAGLQHFGESRVEEGSQKADTARLAGLNSIQWHMIGSIQSRKAREVPGHFNWVHSLDRIKIAQRLSQQAVEDGVMLKVLLQVNLSGEQSKSGFDLAGWHGQDDHPGWPEFDEAIETLAKLPGLDLCGLMTIPPFTDDAEDTRSIFAAMRALRETLQAQRSDLTWQHLSMGMSHDYEVAIEEGATIIRVGTAIFGPRV